MRASPKVFISAASGDLRSARQRVKEALLSVNCQPVEQTNFPPDYCEVADMLEREIAECSAVIHVVGFHYGAEPRDRPAGTPRRSYTQMEFHIARAKKKPVYLFICDRTFDFDAPPCEEEEIKRELQAAHRDFILGLDQLRSQVDSQSDLEKCILKLGPKLGRVKAGTTLQMGKYGCSAALFVCACAVFAALGIFVPMQHHDPGFSTSPDFRGGIDEPSKFIFDSEYRIESEALRKDLAVTNVQIDERGWLSSRWTNPEVEAVLLRMKDAGEELLRLKDYKEAEDALRHGLWWDRHRTMMDLEALHRQALAGLGIPEDQIAQRINEARQQMPGTLRAFINEQLMEMKPPPGR